MTVTAVGASLTVTSIIFTFVQDPSIAVTIYLVAIVGDTVIELLVIPRGDHE